MENILQSFEKHLASVDGGCLARYVNDSPKRFDNCFAKILVIDNRLHVVVIAAKNIVPGCELRYDYMYNQTELSRAKKCKAQTVNDFEHVFMQQTNTSDKHQAQTDRQ